MFINNLPQDETFSNLIRYIGCELIFIMKISNVIVYICYIGTLLHTGIRQHIFVALVGKRTTTSTAKLVRYIYWMVNFSSAVIAYARLE